MNWTSWIRRWLLGITDDQVFELSNVMSRLINDSLAHHEGGFIEFNQPTNAPLLPTQGKPYIIDSKGRTVWDFDKLPSPVLRNELRGSPYLDGTVSGELVNIRSTPDPEAPIILQVMHGENLILAAHRVWQGGLYFVEQNEGRHPNNSTGTEYYRVFAINGIIEPELKASNGYIHINFVSDIKERAHLTKSAGSVG